MIVQHRLLAFAVGGCALWPWSVGAESQVENLGQPPLCEASALQRIPGEPSRWLVADNEVSDRLFMFEMREHSLRPAERSPWLDIEKGPRDIEALAVVGGDLFIVGSHSRDGDCAAGTKAKRRRILRARLTDDRLEIVDRVSGRDAIDSLQRGEASVDDCLAKLFVVPAPAQARRVCDALLAAERRATAERCETFNIEGAVGGGGPPGPERLWLGLRSPLVDGSAALLRLAEATGSLRFDAVSLLDLGGLGVRALARSGDRLYAVAGDPLSSPRSELWVSVFPAPGSHPQPVQFITSLPEGAEGLAFTRSAELAVVVIDGQKPGRDAARCRQAAGQVSVSVPPDRASVKPPRDQTK